MKWQTLALIFFSVSLSAFAQVALKYGISSAQAQREFAGSELPGLAAIATTPYIVLGFAMYALGAVLWLGVLAKIDVGQAYPFVGIGFVLTMGFGVLFLGEAFSLARAGGTLLVLVGVVLVAGSS